MGGSAVDRYRADFGLSTFKDGRGIFDWNVVVVVVDGVVPAVFNVGGGDGATTTEGEIPRLAAPVRFPLFNFGLETITGLFVVAAAVALANTFDTRGLRAAGGGAGDVVLAVCGFDAGNFAVTAEAVFRCGCVVFVLVKREPIFRDNVERNVSAGWGGGWAAGVGGVWIIGCVKFFDVRLDIVITQSRALFLFEWVLIVDVFNGSSIFDGIASGL